MCAEVVSDTALCLAHLIVFDEGIVLFGFGERITEIKIGDAPEPDLFVWLGCKTHIGEVEGSDAGEVDCIVEDGVAFVFEQAQFFFEGDVTIVRVIFR